MDETLNVLESILRLVRVMRRKPNNERQLSNGSYKALRMISLNPQTSSRNLAIMMEIRPSSLTELLKRLEEKGMLVRIRDDRDQRLIRVSITELGLVEMQKYDDAKHQVISSVAECLSPAEQRLFCNLCDKMASHAEQQTDQSRKSNGFEVKQAGTINPAKEEIV